MAARALTPQQKSGVERILDGESLFVRSIAGSGKTHLISEVVKGSKTHPKWGGKRCLILAFNVSAADELRSRCGILSNTPTSREGHGSGPQWSVLTFNSLGHSVLARFLSANKRPFDFQGANKVPKIVGEAFSNKDAVRLMSGSAVKGVNLNDHSTARDAQTFFAAALSAAKVAGMRPDEFIGERKRSSLERIFDIAAERSGTAPMFFPTDSMGRVMYSALTMNNDLFRDNGVADFDDQVYLSTMPPVSGFSRKWDTIICDESQDAGKGNLQQVLNALSVGGQQVLIGDPAQMIYASLKDIPTTLMETHLERNGMKTHDLSISFRCAKKIAARQVKCGIVKAFDPAKDAPEGALWPTETKPWTFKGLRDNLVGLHNKATGEDKPRTFAVLAAFNKSLLDALALAFSERFITMKGEWAYYGQLYGPEFWRKAYAYQSRPERAPTDLLASAANLIRVAAGSMTGVDFYEALKRHVPSAEVNVARASVIFSTVHAAKGLEWDSVLLIDADREMGKPTSANTVRYVAETRARYGLAMRSPLAHVKESSMAYLTARKKDKKPNSKKGTEK